MSSGTAVTSTARTHNTTTLPHAPPSIPDPLPCPRCESLDTKFCYYNNYNLSQPRHFCKSCRRYWTHGGALRNVPVGGGTRKNSKRCRSNSSNMNFTSSTTTANTNVSTPIPGPGPGPVLLASNPKPDFPVLKCENSWDNLNPNDNPGENFVSMPSFAQQEPGFMFGYGSDFGYGFGYGVWGIR